MHKCLGVDKSERKLLQRSAKLCFEDKVQFDNVVIDSQSGTLIFGGQVCEAVFISGFIALLINRRNPIFALNSYFMFPITFGIEKSCVLLEYDF